MPGRHRGVRPGLAVLALAVGLAGCRDSGLPDTNLPLQEAQHREFAFPAYQPLADNVPVVVEGRRWIRSAAVEEIPDRLLTPVATVDGTQLYAVRGMRAPYHRLYARVGPGRWAPFLRLD